jgi:hypothetical protein
MNMKVNLLIVVIGIIGFLALTGYVNADTFNPYQNALAYLARAETSQTPHGVTEYVIAAKSELSRVGHVQWWSTDKETFDSIQAQLDSIITRAENISSPELGSDSEMFKIHSQLRTIQQSLLAF